MQRPAGIGSVAARLNNLEQKVDELEPGGGGGDSALAERLFEITVGGAVDFSGITFPFHESMTVFDTEGTSLSQTVLGIPWEGSPPGAAYWNSITRPFYYQTFSTDLLIDDLFDLLRDTGINTNGYRIRYRLKPSPNFIVVGRDAIDDMRDNGTHCLSGFNFCDDSSSYGTTAFSFVF